MIAERNENSQQSRRINPTLAIRNVKLPEVRPFRVEQAEQISPIPKCNDDQAGNWQGAESSGENSA